MAANEKLRAAKAELQDLSQELQELALNKEGCFYKYQQKKHVGSRIYSELMKKYKHDGGRFLFSDDLPESGVLSICQGLLSVISSVEKMNATTKNHVEIIDSLMGQLFEMTERTDGKGYRLDASPCVVNAKIFDNHAYVDSATWVVSSILGIVRLHIMDKYPLNDQQKRRLADLYQFSVNAIIHSYIHSVSAKRKFVSGWNFTDGCKDPSVYFTFAVSEILIDMLMTFENVIRSADVKLIQGEIVKELDRSGLLTSDKYLEFKDRIDAALQRANESDEIDINTALNEFRVFDESEKRLLIEIWQKFRAIEAECEEQTDKIAKAAPEVRKEEELFRLLNNGCAPYDEDSMYRILEENCKESANNIWAITKSQLANSFFSSNLEAVVSEAAIEASVSSDAVFNVVMIINILINAGIDEDAEDLINYFTVNGSDAYTEAVADYDTMRDTMRLAYDNCYQFFRSMQKKNKDYKINEYILSFDESFGEMEKDVRDLRKAHIRVFSLMPLLVRTKTTMVEFLIRYPQYDMQIFLEHILQYRAYDDKTGKYLWLWENDSYSASSNYYFISSLASFYDYYEKYELAFLENANNNQAAKREIEANYHKQLVDKGKAADKDLAEFTRLEQTVAELKTEIEALREENAGYRSDPLRSALAALVEQVLKETLIDVLAEQLSVEAARIVASKRESVIRRAEAYNEEYGSSDAASGVPLDGWEDAPASDPDGIEKAMNDMMMALLAERLGEAIYSEKPTNDERMKALNRFNDFDKYSKLTGRDFRQAARYYLSGLAVNNKTDFVANRGESTLPGGDHRFLKELIKDKKTNKGDNK